MSEPPISKLLVNGSKPKTTEKNATKHRLSHQYHSSWNRIGVSLTNNLKGLGAE